MDAAKDRGARVGEREQVWHSRTYAIAVISVVVPVHNEERSVALLYDDPAITPRALQKAVLAYQRAGKTDEADRAARQLHEKYPNYAGGSSS